MQACKTPKGLQKIQPMSSSIKRTANETRTNTGMRQSLKQKYDLKSCCYYYYYSANSLTRKDCNHFSYLITICQHTVIYGCYSRLADLRETGFCVVSTAVPPLSISASKCDSNFSLSVVDDDVDTAPSAPSFALKLVLPDDRS